MTAKSKLKSLEKALAEAESGDAKLLYASYLAERSKLKKAEAKLQFLEHSLVRSSSTDVRIIYVSYFAPPVNHTGDGFIDGEE